MEIEQDNWFQCPFCGGRAEPYKMAELLKKQKKHEGIIMNGLKKAEKAWDVLSGLDVYGLCDERDCKDCPQSSTDQYSCVDRSGLQNWLHAHGFPASRPHVYTALELAKQIIKGRSLPCLAQWIAQIEAATCPDCGKHTLFREQRMVCTGCNGVYPADKWAAGEPCGCGCMDARYFGIHAANRLGQLEFQRCQTPGCRWAGDYRRLTVQELADAAQTEAEENEATPCSLTQKKT